MPPGVHLGSLRTVVIRIYGRAAQLADAWTYPRTAAPVPNRCAAPVKWDWTYAPNRGAWTGFAFILVPGIKDQ